MKDIVLKSLMLIPLLIFIDYVIMILVGCTSCLLGFTNDFYSCTYCIIGGIIIGISAITYGVFIFPDVKLLFRKAI